MISSTLLASTISTSYKHFVQEPLIENIFDLISFFFPLVLQQECSLSDSTPSEEFTPDNDWTSRRSAILSKYTTDEKLSMISSYLSGGEKGWCHTSWVLKSSYLICVKNQYKL